MVSRGTSILAALAGRCAALTGRRRAAAALLLGVVATAALPPLEFWPLAIVAFTGLAWLLAGAGSRRAAFATGWWLGVGHFASSLYWIAHAMLVDAARFGWMIPFAVLGLAAGLALFTGAATLGVAATRSRGVARVLWLAIAWTAAEWLRGHVLTGFPWNLIGTIWTGTPALMQVAAATGLYGLSLLTVAFAAMPASLVEPAREAGTAGRGGWIGTAAAVALFALAWTGGAIRLGGAGDEIVPEVRLRLVQPNIPQNLKWDPQRVEENFRHALALSRGPATTPVTHVIWPETAVPFVLAADPARVEALAAVTPPGGLLVTGAIRAVRLADASVRAWNSLQAIDAAGRVVATYDKFHLVPFGEYVPLRGLLDLAKITPGNLDFTPGPGLVTLDLPGLPPVSPLICYEIIFPDEVALRAPRPAWMLNLTNDAWFGISSGPYQHFAAARFRAVEEGLPVVRAANNGISAVVDPHGRVVARLGLGATGVVDASLPRALAPPPYARWGERVVGLLMLVFVVMALLLDGGRRTEGRAALNQ